MERHERLKQIFLAGCELEGTARAELLDRECGGDPSLRREVEAMLDFDTRRPDDRGLGLRLREPAELPERIGPFRVLRLIGSGGMGSVYEVEQDRPHRRVALKLLHGGLPPATIARRLEREGELLGRLQHPGIAHIHESGRLETPFGPQPYLLMELVNGQSLTRWARERHARPRECLELLARVCDAVQHAHEQGVIHRDLKPGNILVQEDGSPKVLDFGIARATEREALASLRTGTGEIVGTLAYMSPEQASGQADKVDARSDVYSLGVMLHELLAGELPLAISDTSLPEAVQAIRNVEPRRLGDVQRAYRGDIETIALKALEKDRTRRYATAAALAADIRRYLNVEPIEARPPSRVYRVRKYVRRHRTPVLAGAAVLVTLAGGVYASLRFAHGEAAERQRATSRDADARAGAYQSGLLGAQRLIEEQNFDAARAQLQALPAELRSGDWGLLDRQLQRQLDQLAVPDVWQATFVDGERVLAVDTATRRTLWDPAAGTTTPLGPAAPGARPLALSQGGKLLLAWSEADNSFVLCDTLGSAGSKRFPLPEMPARKDGSRPQPAGGWRSSAVSDDGLRVAAAFTDGTAWLLDEHAQAAPEPLIGPGYPLLALDFSPDGRRLAAGSREFVRVYDCENRTQLWRIRAVGASFDALEFDGAGHLVLSVTGGVQVRDAETGEIVLKHSAVEMKTEHLGQAFDLTCLPPAPARAEGDDADAGQVALAFHDGSILLFDSATYRLATSFVHKGRSQTSLAASPAGGTLLTCGRADGTLRLWTTAALESEVLGEIGEPVYPLAISRDGMLVATGAWDGMARLWEIPGGRPVAALPNATRRVEALAFAPDGRTLACGLGVEGLATWDVASGRQLVRREDVKAGAVAWSPDGSRLACGDGDGVLLLDPLTLEERLALRPIGNYTTAIAWSPDGQLLAAGSRNGILSLRDAATGGELAHIKGSRGGVWEWTGVRALSFSPDGKRLASGWGSSDLILYDVPGCATPRVLSGARGELFGVAWSPDGQRIATGGRDNLLRLWNPDTGGLMLSLAGHGDYIYSVGFTPDGRRIVTSSGDHSVRLWDSVPIALRWQEQARAARERTGLQPIVDALIAELGDAAAVAARIELLPDLDAEQRRIALDLALESAMRDSTH